MEKENKSLSDDIFDGDYPYTKHLNVVHVKEKIQDAQRRLKGVDFYKIVMNFRYFGAPENGININEEIKKEIDKILKEEFGDELIENGKRKD